MGVGHLYQWLGVCKSAVSVAGCKSAVSWLDVSQLYQWLGVCKSAVSVAGCM